MSEFENRILGQSLNDDDLEQVFGGGAVAIQNDSPSQDADKKNCVDTYYRYIYSGTFANCAATVEDGSWCGTNDACYNDAVVYTGMKDCAKAYR